VITMSSNDEIERRFAGSWNDGMSHEIIRAMRVALNEREHFRRQVDELHVSNSQLLERARTAERALAALQAQQRSDTIPAPADEDFDPRGLSLDEVLRAQERERRVPRRTEAMGIIAVGDTVFFTRPNGDEVKP